MRKLENRTDRRIRRRERERETAFKRETKIAVGGCKEKSSFDSVRKDKSRMRIDKEWRGEKEDGEKRATVE